MPETHSPTLTPARARRLAAAIVLIACIVLLLGAEVAVRVRQAVKYGSAASLEDRLTIDPQTGLRVPIANLRAEYLSTNSHGFRGPEIAVPKPRGTVRLAFIGASTTWSGEVAGNENTWPHLVTESLRKAFPGVRFDYVNAAAPGYTAHSMLLNFEKRVAPLQPDIIVIYEVSNNLSGELRELAAQRGIIREARLAELAWPARYSLLWTLVEKNLRVQRAQDNARSSDAKLEVDASTLGAEYRDGLRQLVRATQQRASLVALATFSIHLRPEQSLEAQFRASESSFFYTPFVTPKLLIEGYARYNDVVRQVAKESGTLLIEGENEIPGDFTHFVDAVHFTAAGSRIMAQRISRGLLASPELRTTVTRIARAQ